MTDKIKQFILDLETSGLPRNSFGTVASVDGRYVPLNMDTVRRNFGHIDIYQFGLGTRDKRKKTTHTSIIPDARPKYTGQVGETVTGYEVVNGVRIPVKQYITKMSEREELVNFLSRSGKLKDKQIRGYVQSVGDVLEKRNRSVNVEAELDGRTINTSKWSFMDLIHTGEYKIGGSSKIQEKLVNNPEYRNLGINFKGRLPAAEFNGRGKNSLYEEISNIVSLGSKDNPAVLGAWNPGYDIEVIRAVLDRNGERELLRSFDTAVANGTIELRAIENEWQQIAYKLVKENPEMRSAFKIRWSPVAFSETSGRSGKIANTFEEFLHSTNKWSAQHVASVFGFTKEIQEALPSGIEEHIASLDVKLTGATQKVFDNLLGYINKELKVQKLNPIKHVSDIRKVKGDQVVTKALNKMIEESSAPGTSAESVLKSISEPAAKLAKFEESQFGSLYANTINKVSHVSNLIKYGTPVAIGMATLLATYGLGGDERSTSVFDRIPNLKNIANKVFHGGKTRTKINDAAERRTHLAKTVATMIAVPVGALWAVGFAASVGKPKLFDTGRTVNTIGEMGNEFFRTFLHGAKRAEKSFALLKIARVTDISNYLFSDKSYGQMANGQWKGKRWDTITTDNKGLKAGERRIASRFDHGVAHEDLLDAAKLSLKDEEFSALKELLEPSDLKSLDKRVARRIPMVSIDAKGRAVIFGQEFDKEGNLLEISEYNAVWKKGITLDAKISINEIRHKDIFGVGPWAKREMNTNAISFYKMQRSLMERNHTYKNSVEEMMRAKGIDEVPGTIKWFEQFMYHALDIGPKGVGESKNILFHNAAYLAQKTSTMINVKSLTGKNAWTMENIQAITKFVSPVMQNFTIEGMNNFLERPFEFIVADPKKIYNYAKELRGSDNILSQTAGRALSFMSAPHLGLPMYNMKDGMFGYLGEWAKKRVLPVMIGFEALRLTDHVLGALMQSPTGRGPLTMAPIKAYEGLSLLYSKISDITGMTAVAKKQESVAPGSTGLGIFAAAASLASTAWTAQKIFAVAPDAVRGPITDIASSILKRSGGENLILKAARGAFNDRTPMRKFASWALQNPKKAIFSMAMIPAIPFLPGFIGSNKTYAERKAEFDGKKEVAIRKNRGWLLSTSPFQGGRISHFRESATSLISKDWENRGVVWPSYWKRFAHNVTGGLYGRYMLEDYHKKDQPVYQSAPYGANIPILGPLLAGSLGKFIKPTIEYHKYGLEHESDGAGAIILQHLNGSNSKTLKAFGTGSAFSKNAINGSQISTDELARHIGLTPEDSSFSLANKFSKGLHDFIGFRGFGYEAVKSAMTGLKTPDEFTPYAQSASEFYNTSQQLWNYSAGDVTLVGGEFLRRIFQYPDKRWTVNQLPNEFNGVSWIPQKGTDMGQSSKRDMTHGTTFDKIPMGWLHATRKGWEFQFPEVKGVDMENYPDPIRVEILKHMAPFSGEFNAAATQVQSMALTNKLTPEQEQRYYESLQQVGQLKDQLYAYEGESNYNVSTTKITGNVQDVDDTGRFTLNTMPGRTFKLAGVSLDEEDVRARLLKEHSFKDQYELSHAMQETVGRTKDIMSSALYAGKKVSIDVASMDQGINPQMDIEAVMGSVNTNLIDKGAGFINTGNLAKYNMFQKMNGFPGKVMGKVWDTMTSGESFWINKLKPQRDYLSHYKYSNVYNRDVKLWNHPIEQIFKPMIASTLHKFGMQTIPQFTIARRHNQEYWDILKYIKGKMLENKTGNPEYRDMWKSTMIGADPVRGTHEELLKALPENERAFFSRFANEPSAKKRGQILKYIPAAQRRIYTSIWAQQQHAANLSHNKEEEDHWDNIKSTEGFGMTKDEERQYRNETSGKMSRADWKRARYIQEYAKSNYIPEANDDMWKENVDLDSVELLSLRADGENIEDYGFFEDKARIAAYDGRANVVAVHLKSQVLTMSSSVGSIMPYIASDYNAKDAQSTPSMTINPLAQHQINTNGYQRLLNRSYNRYVAEMADDLIMVALRR